MTSDQDDPGFITNTGASLRAQMEAQLDALAGSVPWRDLVATAGDDGQEPRFAFVGLDLIGFLGNAIEIIQNRESSAGHRAEHAIRCLLDCASLIDEGDVKSAASAMGTGVAHLGHAYIEVVHLPRLIKTFAANAQRREAASKGGKARSARIRSVHSEIVEGARNSKKKPGTRIAGLAAQLAPGARRSKRQVERILTQGGKEYVLDGPKPPSPRDT